MQSSEIIRRRNLPHWDVPTAAYFVTVCLDDSIPARGRNLGDAGRKRAMGIDAYYLHFHRP